MLPAPPPPRSCDSYATGSRANGYNGTLPALHPGALLAVAPADAPAVLAQVRIARLAYRDVEIVVPR